MMFGHQRPDFLVKVTVADGLGGHDCGRGYLNEKNDIDGFQAIEV